VTRPSRAGGLRRYMPPISLHEPFETQTYSRTAVLQLDTRPFQYNDGRTEVTEKRNREPDRALNTVPVSQSIGVTSALHQISFVSRLVLEPHCITKA
jgi:hypothetical protein